MGDFSHLLERIDDKNAVVGVVGLGYVGLPVAVAFAEAGFEVIGIDVDADKVRSIQSGDSFLFDVPAARISSLTDSNRLRASTSFDELSTADAILICVPTPITEGAPDLSQVTAAGTAIGKILKRGALVVLESTTYPGSTDELLRPLLEGDRYVHGEDFLLAFSPERIDPGNPIFSFTDIPKVVGGLDDDSTAAAAALYGQVVSKVVIVSGAKEAELAKLIENTFRHVNIALVNELAVYAHDMGIDIWEAIEAAASKPFGFMPFWPGPGWGGHCIPLDPAYLSWRVRRDRAHEVRFVELAQTVNSEMPRWTAHRVSLLLNDKGKSVKDAKILGIGIAYKAGTEDTRESGAIKVLDHLMKQGATVSFHDPLVAGSILNGKPAQSVPLTRETLAAQDIVVVFVPQTGVDWEMVATESPVLLDCCNALRRTTPTIHRL